MNLQRLQEFDVPVGQQTYTSRDSAIYALSLGYGSEPTHPWHLAYLLQDAQQAVPSQCTAVANPGFWQRDQTSLEIDWVRMLNGEYGFTVHRPLPPAGTVQLHTRIVAVEDKGEGKGAAMYLEKQLLGDDGELFATNSQTCFLRGAGGRGGFGAVPRQAPAAPTREPDVFLDLTIARNAALLYSLNGDYNPVHSHPHIARQAGYDEPFMHGLCSLGMACRAALEALCKGDPLRLASMSVRFSNVVFPGETLRFEFFVQGLYAQWRARVLARDVTVMDRGQLTLGGASPSA